LPDKDQALSAIPVKLLALKVSQQLNSPEYATRRTESHSLWESLRKGQLGDHESLMRLVAADLRMEVSLWCEQARCYGREQGLQGAALADFCLEVLKRVVLPKIQERFEHERESYAMVAGISSEDREALRGMFSFLPGQSGLDPDPLNLLQNRFTASPWAKFSATLYMEIHDEIQAHRFTLEKERDVVCEPQCVKREAQQPSQELLGVRMREVVERRASAPSTDNAERPDDKPVRKTSPDDSRLDGKVGKKLADPTAYPLMTVEEAAFALSKSKSTVYRLLSEGKLVWSKTKGRIPTASVRRLTQPSS
jgi:excisionase family DNA binding protein